MFRVSPLSFEGSYPPSIPLVLPRGYECEFPSGKIQRRPVQSSCPPGADDLQQLTLVPEALRLLEGIEKPVAILGICGPYRSGKSYLMSRVLGVPNTFQVSNGINACTRGVWMATSALECEDYVIVLLDTEGTDGICSGGDLLQKTKLSFSILVLTTVMSSHLVYNSMQIPRRSDLDVMSCFTELASSIRMSASCEVTHQIFPHFLWLLRDSMLLLENENGNPVSLVDYIRSFLQAESSPENHDNIAHTLLNLFPSFECEKLPCPSKEDLQNDYETPSNFSSAFDVVKQHILQAVKPKKVCDSDAYFNGRMIAALATECLDSLNTPNSVPDLANGWKFAIKHALGKKRDNLACEYESEMTAILNNYCLPLEEDDTIQHQPQPPVVESYSPEIQRRSPEPSASRALATSNQPQIAPTPIAKPTLMSIHHSVYAAKKAELCKEIDRYGSIRNTEREEILRDFESRIVCYNDIREVTGGRLYGFLQKNRVESSRQCRAKFNEIVSPLVENFEQSISTISILYQSVAVGPAKNDVYESQVAEFEYRAKYLSPSAPSEIEIIGKSPNQLKIKWSPPDVHQQAVNQYEVQIKTPDMEWSTIAKTDRQSILVNGLKSATKYLFRVRGLNTRRAGEWTEELEATTRLNKAEQAAAVASTFVGGTVAAPFILTAASFSYSVTAWRESNDEQTRALAATGIAVGVAMLPFMFCYYAIAYPGPVVGKDMAKAMYERTKVNDEDDLSTQGSEYVDMVANINERRDSVDTRMEQSHRDVIAPEAATTGLTLLQDFSQPEDDHDQTGRSGGMGNDSDDSPPIVYLFDTYGQGGNDNDVDSQIDEAFHSAPKSQQEL